MPSGDQKPNEIQKRRGGETSNLPTIRRSLPELVYFYRFPILNWCFPLALLACLLTCGIPGMSRDVLLACWVLLSAGYMAFTWYRYLALNQANKALREQNYERARECAQRSLRMDPANPNAYLIAAQAEIMLYQPERALELCSQSIAMAPKNSIAYLIRGAAFSRMNRHDETIADCEHVIASIKNRKLLAVAYSMKGAAHGAKREFDKAIEACNRALKIDPKDRAALINRAHVHCIAKDLRQAEEDLETLAHQSSEPYFTGFMLSNWGRIRLLQGKPEEALEDVTRATELCPADAAILATRGHMLFRNGKHEEALADLCAAIAMDPHCAEAYWFRHEVYAAMGESEKSAQDIQVAEGYGYVPHL